MTNQNADSSEERTSAMPEEGLDLQEILRIEVSEERVERLKQLTAVDAPDVSDEVFTWLIRQQAQWANIQYTRFLAGTNYTEEDIDALLTNSIDTHVHGGSDPFERLLLEDDIGMDCTDAGMRAIVIKTWYTPSASRNALVQKIVNQYADERVLRPVEVFGGVTLNYSQGGINPEAVKRCLGFPGMKYVWMPMVDSYHHRRVVYDDWSGHGLHLLDENGRVLPELQEILRIIADNDLILGTGHYPYADSAILIEEARRLGVTRIEVIHPAHIHSKHTIDQMKEQAERGAKLMLSGLGALAFPLHESGPLYAARIIKEVGKTNVVYGSDFGQFQNLPHITATRWMIKLLLAYGCSQEDLYHVFQVTPAAHLGIEPPPPLGTNKDSEKYRGHPQADPAARQRTHGWCVASERTDGAQAH